MSLDEFLKNPYGHSSNDGQSVIAQASVWPAWEVSNGRDKTYFRYKADKDGKNEAEAKELADNFAGPSGSGSFVNQGIVTSIFIEDAIQCNFNDDWHSFVPVYHSKKQFYVTARGEEKLEQSGHLAAIQDLIEKGPFPYDTLIEYLKKNPGAFENKKWCKLIRKDETVLQAKGYTTQFFVVDKVYNSREEALKDAGANNSNNDNVAPASAEASLSETASGNGWTIAQLQATAVDITSKVHALVDKSPLPKDKAENVAISQVAGDYGISTSDFILIGFDVPF